MIKNFIVIFICIICIKKISSQVCSTFVDDEECVYKEKLYYLWTKKVTIDFYVSWKVPKILGPFDIMVLDFDSLTMNIPHPLAEPTNVSKDVPTNASYNIPKEFLNLGWNKLFFVYNSFNQTLDISVGKHFWLSIHFYQGDKGSFIQTSGLNALIDCMTELRSRYYRIFPGTDMKIPVAITGVGDYFSMYSEKKFSMEITLSNRTQLCKSIRDYSARDVCSCAKVSTFEPHNVFNVYFIPLSYARKDIFTYGDYVFADIIIHNIGSEMFYVQTFVNPDIDIPLSVLFSRNATRIIPRPNTAISRLNINTVKDSTTEDPIKNVTGTENSSLFKTIIISVSCISIVILIVGLGCYIVYSKKPQQRIFENPISAGDFASWPGLDQSYVNAEPIGNRTEAMTANAMRFHNSPSNSGKMVFANYNDPSLRPGKINSVHDENPYEEYYEREEDQTGYVYGKLSDKLSDNTRYANANTLKKSIRKYENIEKINGAGTAEDKSHGTVTYNGIINPSYKEIETSNNKEQEDAICKNNPDLIEKESDITSDKTK